MAIHARILCFLVLVAVWFGPTLARADERTGSSNGEEFAHVRSSHAKLAGLIADATAQSPTFRKLVASIESTDGIVFIEEGKCPHALAACLSWKMTQAGGNRLLFVFMKTDRPNIELIASVGHELQHALEVLSNPGIRSSRDVLLFYTRGLTPALPRPAETVEAEAMGNAVYRELRGTRRRGRQ